MLINKVIVPMVKLTCREITWAKTLHGDAPVKETINKPYPNPNNISPKHKKKNVENFGLRLWGLFDVQFTFGIFLIFKNIFG